MSDADQPGKPRSAGAIPGRRVPQHWPPDRRFRILSIDGGGIRGVFPATFLAGLESAYTGERSIGDFFDLIVGTSTGGILALGLGAGYTAASLRDLYVRRGGEVFPPYPPGVLGGLTRWLAGVRQYTRYRYDRASLEKMLTDVLGDKQFGESRNRLCVPAFEGKHSEVFVYKTPHHLDYKLDRFEKMVKVGLATAAAPTYFRPLEHNDYTLVDGGVWANNPLMLGVIEALTCFDITRDQIDVLSIGCGDDKYHVSGDKLVKGGIWHWRMIIEGAMRLQSLAATNQARLLLGPPSVTRIDPPAFEPPIPLDDWQRATFELVPAARAAVRQNGPKIAEVFLMSTADAYVPQPVEKTATAT